MTNHQVTDRLNHLVHINKDADAGFRTAAGNVNNSEIQTLFAKYADAHAKFSTELQSEVDRIDGEPADSGTAGGAIHRGWMDVKAALTGHSVNGMLTACQSAERSAESAYLDALKLIPHGQTHTILQKQCEQIQAFAKRLKRLVGEIKDGVEFRKNS